MKLTLATVPVVAGLLVMIAGCAETGGDGADAGSPTSAPQAPAPTATTEVVSPQEPTTATSSPASWVMPNVVGQNLQAAQDAIQALTANAVFLTSSTDATGQGRAQVLDANWKVCAQNIRPGEMITTTTKIEFAAVKLEEQCP